MPSMPVMQPQMMPMAMPMHPGMPVRFNQLISVKFATVHRVPNCQVFVCTQFAKLELCSLLLVANIAQSWKALCSSVLVLDLVCLLVSTYSRCCEACMVFIFIVHCLFAPADHSTLVDLFSLRLCSDDDDALPRNARHAAAYANDASADARSTHAVDAAFPDAAHAHAPWRYEPHANGELARSLAKTWILSSCVFVFALCLPFFNMTACLRKICFCSSL